MNKVTITQMVKLYNDAGWTAVYHPLKHTISLNGHRNKPEKEAVKEMLECLLRNNKVIPNIL